MSMWQSESAEADPLPGMQARWLRIWSSAPPLPVADAATLTIRAAYSTAPNQKSARPPKRDSVRVIQHHAKIADLQHAAKTSVSPAAAPTANLSRSLRFFHPFIDKNAVPLKKPLDLTHNPEHARAWQDLLRTGWTPLQLQGQLHKLLKHEDLLVAVFKLTAHQLEQAPADSSEVLEAWQRFETIIALLVRRKNPDGSVTCTSKHMDSFIADWLWSGFRTAASHQQHASHVLQFWRLLLRLQQKPASGLKDFQTYNLRLSPRVHNAIVTAASLCQPNLKTFLCDYASTTSLHSLKDSNLSTGATEARTLAALQEHFDSSQRKQAFVWMQQADLALLWARGGLPALHHRVRRWADRKDTHLIARHLDAVLNACSPQAPEQAWLELVWADDDATDSSALAASEEDEMGSESEASPLTQQVPFHQTLRASPSLFTSFIISLLRLNQAEKIEALWIHLQECHLQPTPLLWQALLAGQMRRGDLTGAQAVIHNMKAAGVEISPMIHLDEARTLFRVGDVAAGMAKVSWMVQNFDPLPTEVYKRLFHAMIRRGLFSQAFNLLRSVPRELVDVSTLNPFITWFCRKGHAESGFPDALELLQRFGLKPDPVTYTILLNGALDSGRHADAANLIGEMQSREAFEGTRIYGSILTHLAQSGSAQLLQQSLELLSLLERRTPQVLNEIVYASVIQALCQQTDFQPSTSSSSSKVQLNRFNMPYHLEQAHALTDKMHQRGIPVTAHVYNALISGHLAQGTPASISRALGILQDLRKSNKAKVGRDFVDPTTWRTVLYGLMHADEWDLAKQVVKEMDKLAFKPQGALAQATQRIRDHRQR